MKFSHVKDVVKYELSLFNQREDVKYYQIALFDKDFNSMPFSTKYRIMKVDYKERVNFEVYVRKSDLNLAKLAILLSIIGSASIAESSSLALTLPNPPMNYQSDRFRSGNLDCSNAVGGGINLEYGVTGVLSGLDTINQGKDLGVYARIVIPLDRPRSRINCDDLYRIELTQRKLEIQMLQEELKAMRDLQATSMEFEN